MSQFELLPELITHFRNYASGRANLALEEFEIEETLVPWLEKIQAPASLRGLGIISHSLHKLSQDAVTKQRLDKLFGLPSWFFDGFGYAINFANTKHELDFYNPKMGSGWCEDAPLYAWLFRLSHYSKNSISIALQLLFLEQYFKTLVDLKDPHLSSASKSREQEVCSATRLIFDGRNLDYKKLLSLLTLTDLDSISILVKKIEDFYKSTQISIEPKNKNYLRTFVHFLMGDWEGRRYRGNRNLKRMIARRFNKTQLSFIQGQDPSIKEIIPGMSSQLDIDGVDADDFYPQQLYVALGSDCLEKSDMKEIQQAERIFDPLLNQKKSIDVTHKIRRSQNVALQSNELLKAGDLARLIRFMQRMAKPRHQYMSLIYWTMLLIGKSVDELSNLFIFDDLQQLRSGIYVDTSGDGWWCFPVTYSAKPRLDDDQRGLISTASHAFTPCPHFYMLLLRCHYSGGVLPLVNSDMTAELLAKRLKKYSDHLSSGHRVSLEKISSFMERFCFASGSIDPTVLDFSYQLALSNTRVTRSYACIDDPLRFAALDKLWNDITVYIHSADSTLLCPIFFEFLQWHHQQCLGSTFTPSHEACVKLVNHLQQLLIDTSPARTCPLVEVIEFHNAYVAYTSFLLLFATGYRAVHNPLPALSLALRSYGLLGISDKDDADFTHARLVSMPELLAQQLAHLTTHLQRLAQMIRYHDPSLAATVDTVLKKDEQLLSLGMADASHWFKTVRNSRKELGPLFIFRSINRQWRAVNVFPALLAEFLPPALKLPSNAGRHWLKSQLLARKVDPELIDWQMGHWMTGQAPLGYYSVFSHVEASLVLAPILDDMLREVGWTALPSQII